MTNTKRYTEQELNNILEQFKKEFPIGSVVKHVSGTGKITEVVIKSVKKWQITTDNLPTEWQLPQGVGYGRFYFWYNGDRCVLNNQ